MPRLLRVWQSEDGSLVRLTVEEEGEGLVPTRRTYRVGEETYLAIGAPASGDVLTEDDTAALADGEGLCAAQTSAARTLAYGDISRRALARKLRTKGYGEENANAAVDTLVARGYLKEEEQAYRFAVRAVATKCWGRRRVLSALLEKGYPADIASRAIEAAEENGEIDFAQAKERLIASRIARLEKTAARRAARHAAEEGTALFEQEETSPEDTPALREEIRRLLWRYGY